MRSKLPPALIATILAMSVATHAARAAAPATSVDATGCLRPGETDPVTITACMAGAVVTNKIESCLRYGPAFCLGPNSELRRAGRWIERKVLLRIWQALRQVISRAD